MSEDLSGFWQQIEGIRFPSPVASILGATCDRFLESRFFLKKILDLSAEEEFLHEANWLFSAHLTSTISIWDAAKYDFNQAKKGKLFVTSKIGKEFFLKSNANDPLERDPMAINRAYRDLRNLRVHHAIPIVKYGRDVWASISVDEDHLSIGQWFFNPIEASRHHQLRDPQLSQNELQEFNQFMRHKPAISLASQHLYILYRTIMETATGTFGIS